MCRWAFEQVIAALARPFQLPSSTCSQALLYAGQPSPSQGALAKSLALLGEACCTLNASYRYVKHLQMKSCTDLLPNDGDLLMSPLACCGVLHRRSWSCSSCPLPIDMSKVLQLVLIVFVLHVKCLLCRSY